MYPFGPALGVPVTSGAGCSYHGTQIHAPNENIRLPDYWLAMRCMGHFLHAFGSGA
jgi:acetylornithine deacetylase/succinyl-diaminopimelate desuccinylase-like protein